jgi:hypothetical protein
MQGFRIATEIGLTHPRDSKNKPSRDRFTSAELEKATEEYREACALARAATLNHLRALADTLQVWAQLRL